MWELEWRYKRHKNKCYAEQECLNYECDQFWEAFVDVSFKPKVKSKQLSDTEEYRECQRHYNHCIRRADEDLVEAGGNEQETIQNVVVAMIIQ